MPRNSAKEQLVTVQNIPPPRSGPRRLGFAEDFKRFFLRGLATILPTLVTLWLLVWAWNFLWQNIGQYLINLISYFWYYAGSKQWVEAQSPHYIYDWALYKGDFATRLLGVGLSVVLVYFVGVLVGNLIGRAFWRVAERALLRIPLVRAIYPAVKQVTDFVLADHAHQFQGSRVVAVQPHEQNIWSIGLVTSARQWTMGDSGPEEMMTVFVPSTPTSFSGYVLVVPRSKVVELPMTVEEAMRLLVTGGVIMPGEGKTAGREPAAADVLAGPPPVRIQVQPLEPPRHLEKTG
ncbi:MAG TPA: DUF502 domain-containing protein [Tepidisphaeraceae bacterium]|jgi:uncharacterized membrane protein|nr:DUF502 domain-containing protein [Tepidisphaeraceae bacterium]